VGLEEKAEAWTSKLSGGQRQRLSLACALVGDPELLVLDEPTTGLDPQARLRMGETIRSYRDRGRAILVSTHYMDEAQRLCDRVAVIDRGKVIALGTPMLVLGLWGALSFAVALRVFRWA
jgi:ABC-2 type transport system ATP-binding protein